MARKILLTIDLGDPDSIARIFPVAEEMAEKYGDDLHILCVVPNYSMPIVGSFFPEQFEKKALKAASEALSEVIAANAKNPAAVKGHVANGSIYEEIIRVADDLGARLIVMESHRPALKDYLLGPNAARVVRHAKQSVYVHRA
jgi:universal stress protein F